MKEKFWDNVYKPYITVKEQGVENDELVTGDIIDVSLGKAVVDSDPIVIPNMKVVSIIDGERTQTAIFMKESILIVATFSNATCAPTSITLYGSEVNYFHSILVRAPKTDVDWVQLDANLTYPKKVTKSVRRALQPGDILESHSRTEALTVEYIAKDGSIVAYRKVPVKCNQSDVVEYRSIILRRTDETVMQSLCVKLDWCA